MENDNTKRAKELRGITAPLSGTIEGITLTKQGILRVNPIRPRKKRKKPTKTE
jgi:hypothetical protein